MEQRFIAEINRLNAGIKSGHTILAISGGVDSVVLTTLFAKTGYSFSLAHCNFQLRGKEADQDEDFVCRLASKIGVEVVVRKFETDKYAREKKISIQMAARELRYDWFKKLMAEKGCFLATAHHANDLAETLLFNLAKGTGMAGLHGIPQTDGKLIRPLLWAEKAEIIQYATESRLSWREDASNQSNKYMRNAIRNKVIPALEKINPGFIKTTLRTAARIKSTEEFFNYAVEQLNLLSYHADLTIINTSLLERVPGQLAVLYQLISPFGFNYDQCQSVLESLYHSGAVFQTDKFQLNIDRDSLIVGPLKQEGLFRTLADGEFDILVGENRLTAKIFNQKGYKIPNDKKVACLDSSKLIFPLIIRNWQQGDRFTPLGMKGTKLVSDFLINEKVPLALKNKTMVVVSGDKICWLVGHRVSEKFKISSRTAQIYQLSLTSDAY